MDENLNQQNWGGMSNNNGSMPPPPPPPEITLRTMQSDIESIKQSGGENPIPKPFTPPEIKNQANMELGDLSREDGMIKPNNGEGVVPPSEPPKKKFKIFILITVLILVIAGAVFAGYKFIYPMFKPVLPVNVPQEQPVVIPENIPVVENTEPEVLPPLSEEATSTQEELATTTATTTPEIVPAPVVVVMKQHATLLTTPADSVVSLILPTSTPVSLISLKEALSAEAANKPSTAVALKEVALSNQDGQLVFADTLSAFLPAFTSVELAPLFEDDFTGVIFYDDNGTWFGMIAKLKDGADLAAAKASINKLEKFTDLVNLYIQDPGTMAAAGFKDGKANSVVTRYVGFSKTGASLNYGWTGNNLLVISTSYNGAKAMLTKLGVQ
jgi:hypothetical protein